MRNDDDDLGFEIKGLPSPWDGVVTMIALVMTIIFTVMLWEDKLKKLGYTGVSAIKTKY